MEYDIQIGDIFIAIDGSKNGHLVIGFDDQGDVFTYLFTDEGVNRCDRRSIDPFKLSKVRYYKPEMMPDWIPEEVYVALDQLSDRITTCGDCPWLDEGIAPCREIGAKEDDPACPEAIGD
jgi:hypothetical protein